jgi:hypothetical protein
MSEIVKTLLPLLLNCILEHATYENPRKPEEIETEWKTLASSLYCKGKGKVVPVLN